MIITNIFLVCCLYQGVKENLIIQREMEGDLCMTLII